MHEADLRLHLAKQGLADVRSVPFPAASQGPEALEEALQRALSPPSPGSSAEAVLFDVADAPQLATIGQVLWAQARRATLLAVGPSSVVDALATALGTRSDAQSDPRRVAPARGPVLVLAGSLSPVTARQVAAARSFDTVWLDAPRLARLDAATLERYAEEIAQGLARGRNVLACTRPAEQKLTQGNVNAQALARAGGDLLAKVLARAPLQRIGIAGGDTSSHAVQALDAWGLSYVADMGAGASLCRVHSDDAVLDGMEIMLKGGQMGSEDVFERLVQGAAN
jgi:uncharacterized protein YgbK (DUF1537 family)